MFEIEKSVPIPTGSSDGEHPRQIYPFPKMDVGDSFAVGSNLEPDVRRIRRAAGMYGKRNGRAFIVRKDEKGEYRCWRSA